MLKARPWRSWMFEERNWLAMIGVGAGMAGLYLGVMAVFLVPNLLPFGAAEYVARKILREGSSWQAGIRLMNSEDPLGVSQLAAADRLMRANAAVIEACREAAIDNEGRCWRLEISRTPTRGVDQATALLSLRIPTKPAGDSDLKPAVIPR